jgi:rod shape-determining protein MreD
MANRRGSGIIHAYAGIIFSFFIAFSLVIFPLPASIAFLRPDFVLLVLTYWVVNLPNRAGVVMAFIVGIFYDLLAGSLFGVMGLTMSIVAFLQLICACACGF